MTETFIVGLMVLAAIYMLVTGGAGRIGLVLVFAVGVLLAPTFSGIVGKGVDLTRMGSGAVSSVGTAAR